MAATWCLQTLASLVVIACFAGYADAGSYCNVQSGYYNTYYTYCTYGCCGDSSSLNGQYCCSYYSIYTSSYSIVAIVSGVIGGVIALSIIITVICCIVRRRSHPGQVIMHGGNPAGANVVVASTISDQTMQHQMAAQSPPSYVYSNPAYPQGSVPQNGMPPPNPAYPPGAVPQNGLPQPNPAYPPAAVYQNGLSSLPGDQQMQSKNAY